MPILSIDRTRLYDFQPGTVAKSSEVDAEFNQLIDAHNIMVDDLLNLDGAIAVEGENLIGAQVDQNKQDIVALKGVGWTNESTKDNADAIADLAGVGRTLETVKGVYDEIIRHISSADHDGRYYTVTEIDSKISTINSDINDVDNRVDDILDGTTSLDIPLDSYIADKLSDKTLLGKSNIGDYNYITLSDSLQQLNDLGYLTASQIQAMIDGLASVPPSQTTITNVYDILYADEGRVSRLTADQLMTGSVLEGTPTIYFIHAEDQFLSFIEGLRQDHLPKVDYTTRDGKQLYWADAEKTYMTTIESDESHPLKREKVQVYQYQLNVKMSWYFEEDPETGWMIPKVSMGLGSGYGNNAKGFLYKNSDSVVLEYYHSSTGERRFIELSDDGINIGGDGQYTAVQDNLVWDDLRLASGVLIPTTGVDASTLTFELTSSGHSIYNLNFEVAATASETLTIVVTSTSGERRTITKTLASGETDFVNVWMPIPTMHPLDTWIKATLSSTADALTYSNLEASLMGAIVVNQVSRTPDPFRPVFREVFTSSSVPLSVFANPLNLVQPLTESLTTSEFAPSQNSISETITQTTLTVFSTPLSLTVNLSEDSISYQLT